MLVYDVDLNGHIVSGPAYFGSFPNNDPDPGINNCKLLLNLMP